MHAPIHAPMAMRDPIGMPEPNPKHMRPVRAIEPTGQLLNAMDPTIPATGGTA